MVLKSFDKNMIIVFLILKKFLYYHSFSTKKESFLKFKLRDKVLNPLKHPTRNNSFFYWSRVDFLWLLIGWTIGFIQKNEFNPFN